MPINWAAVKGAELVPEDWYTLQFKSFIIKPTKAKDSQNVEATFLFSEEDEGYKGRSIRHWFNLKETAIWSLKNFIVCSGVDEDDLNEDERELPELLGSRLNSKVRAYVVQGETQDGRPVNSIKTIKGQSDWEDEN